MIYEAPKITVDDQLDIHIYVCHLLDVLGDLTDEQLSDIITECEAVNYYNYLESLSMIVEKQLVEVIKKGDVSYYHLLPQGKTMSDEFHHRIPLSVREKSIEYGKKVLEMSELERSIKCKIEKTQDKHCFVHITFLNEMGGPDLLQMRLYAPNFDEAKKMRERFYEKPSDIVTKIMQTFIKDSFI